MPSKVVKSVWQAIGHQAGFVTLLPGSRVDRVGVLDVNSHAGRYSI